LVTASNTLSPIESMNTTALRSSGGEVEDPEHREDQRPVGISTLADLEAGHKVLSGWRLELHSWV
jgi:hypothetical protein